MNRRRPPVRALAVLAIFGSILTSRFDQVALAVDAVFAAALVLGWQRLWQPGAASVLFRRIAPWLYLYALGQFLGLIGFGLTFAGLLAIGRNLLPVIVFCVFVGLLERRPVELRAMVVTYTIAAVFVVATVIAGGGPRGEGVFDNPNYAAHFLACAVLLVPFLPWRRSVKIILAAAFCVGILRTGSFAAAAMLGAMAAATLWVRLARVKPSHRPFLRFAWVITFAGLALVGWSQLSGAKVDLGSGLDSSRFERASATRTGLWSDAIDIFSDHPLGVGADGIRLRNLTLSFTIVTEIHTDLLDALVAGGIPAVLGMVGIVSALWRSVPRASFSRATLAGLVAGSVFHQTWNFRHMWLFLAVVLAIEMSRGQTATPRLDGGETLVPTSVQPEVSPATATR